ncbi:uncharacterized protein LOC120176230 [Hibiscus syriacus]|uniref:uncharacterized protein LOC120176230 n=1 Tax=Hibiscus syriacus TaxID=106335 RepID=UPI001920EB47|nr:uncharacterized protein LOC120176230 [Hibiscus syriacus]
MVKMVFCASDDGDIITVKADDGADTVTFTFDSPILYKRENMGYTRLYLAPRVVEEVARPSESERKVNSETKDDVEPPEMEIKSRKASNLGEGNEVKVEEEAKLEKVKGDNES